MSLMENLDLYTNDIEEVDVKDTKLEPDLFGSSLRRKERSKTKVAQYQKSKDSCARQGSEENRSSTGQSGTDQEQSPIDDANLCSTSPTSSAPVCRQFWKAGNYNEGLPSKSMLQNRTSYLHIHPKFLHSNATSHKWAFGAIAELLDNAVDEIANGATFVNVDKTSNPRDGTTALLIQAGHFLNPEYYHGNKDIHQDEEVMKGFYECVMRLVPTLAAQDKISVELDKYKKSEGLFGMPMAVRHRSTKSADDGGGMDPEAMRRCLSFGFSDKKSKSAIGQYGNGFKTSSMRLGADVIVFSRHMKGRVLTQSIGLLSYTFLTQTGHDRIVVPMVDYEFNESTSSFDTLRQYSKEHFMSNLSMLLQWSPYSTEAELLKQFDDISCHGTKVIIYNLWLIDEGKMELDFESDAQDIRIAGEANNVGRGGARMQLSDQHLANCLRYSLREYLSVLYLRIPETFCIVLRGRVVEYHNIANDLKFPEFILYKPQSCGSVEGKVITTIGFLKEAPHVNIHGFNVYHKNRLILPFWHVVSYSDSRGRGVVGVLEANFIEPTHNKQDFEKTPVFQKLEARLKEMTWEYWDYHCGLIGYNQVRKLRAPITQGSTDSRQHHGTLEPVSLSRSSKAVYSEKPAPAGASVHNPASNSSFLARKPGPPMLNSQRNSHSMLPLKRKDHDLPAEPENVKRKAVIGVRAIDTGLTHNMQPAATGNHLENLEAVNLRQENMKLHAQCSEYEKKEEQLNLKVNGLRVELKQAQRDYAQLLIELRLLEKENIKGGTN